MNQNLKNSAGDFLIENAGLVTGDLERTVDNVINHVGKDIRMAMTLALGKPVLFANELYRRAKEDPEISLKVITALPLEKPKGHTEIEERFLKPISKRLFDGVPEFDFMIDLRAGKLPGNVEIFEFYSKAGCHLDQPEAQQNHIASNYTHIVRDAINLGVNVFAQLIGFREENGKILYSMGCNTDVCIDALKQVEKLRAQGIKGALVAEANKNMPFMYGDAVIEGTGYDFILKGDKFDYPLFGAPKDPVAPADHMIGINVSTLVKDNGTIQVGIGALGDAIVSGLVMRNEHNEIYQEIINKAKLNERYGDLINKWGDTGIFEEGLYGSSEMFVDAFMQMYKSRILKRKVYDSVPLMKLINSGKLKANYIPEDIIDTLIEMKAIHSKLNKEDFDFLTEFGIFKDGLVLNGESIKDGSATYKTDLNEDRNRKNIRKLLGKELKNGKVILGAFFVGPKSFYQALNDMSEEERQLFGMSGVEKVNQLYGGEELRTLQRKNARFINTGMKATLVGAVASDYVEDGRVISGIGGQYNFVSMAHALPDARLIIMIKSVKGSGKDLKSNIVFSYGSCAVPKHLKDIIVTEYGIADVRGRPEKEIIAKLINIADSRFQDELLDQAKKAGKIPMDYKIPEEYRNNTPEKITSILGPYQKEGYFKPFPFGTDLTQDDIDLGGSLKALKALSTGSPFKLRRKLIAELFKPIPESAERHIVRMELHNPSSLKERVMRKLIVFALRNNKKL